jgi:hypothetical protein
VAHPASSVDEQLIVWLLSILEKKPETASALCRAQGTTIPAVMLGAGKLAGETRAHVSQLRRP